MAKIIIFGIGDNAQLAYYYLSKDTEHEIVAFTVDGEFITGETFCDLPVCDFKNIENIYSPMEYKMFVAIGYTQVNQLRAAKYLEAKQKGYELISYISPRATIYDNVLVGENCFILEDNTIQPFVIIGNNVVLWSGNHIGHHSTVGDHCFITSHVVISGRTSIGAYTFIGVNSTLRDHINIGKYCVIGAGSIIMHDTTEYEVYVPERTPVYIKQSQELRRI